MESTETAEKEASLEYLNNLLTGWSDIYNGLRGNSDFESRVDFLWRHVFERIYKQEVPSDAKFAIEVIEDTYERLKKDYPQNV